MLLKNKIIPIALVAALLGGSVGAIVSRKSDEPVATNSLQTTPSANLIDEQSARQVSADSTAADPVLTDRAANVEDADSYRAGFLDGFQAARERTSDLVTQSTVVPASRVVYRNAPARRYYGRSSTTSNSN